MTDFKKWFVARARNPDKITLEEAFNAGKRSAPSVPDVDALAQFIRRIDGAHQLGAAMLAERIADRLAASPEAKP